MRFILQAKFWTGGKSGQKKAGKHGNAPSLYHTEDL